MVTVIWKKAFYGVEFLRKCKYTLDELEHIGPFARCFCNFARTRIMDLRKEWFRKCILDYLGETDAELTNIFLSRNDRHMGRKFDSFLDDKPQSVINLYNQIFVVYKTYYSKMVEEEIQVLYLIHI